MSTRRVFPKGDPLVTYGQAADRMGCSASTVRRLVRDGELLAVRPRPNIVRIPQSAIDAYLAACTTGGTQ
ncbi:MAG: excisionase family DNA-binding protein [Actinomycetota bacterium]|nr:excisionase family DNA-binding protein [Actinomycetota bacterium]